MLVPICIGLILLFVSWYLSYPVSIDSQYDFVYNHFSYLYWISLAVLFVSFFVVAMKTANNNVRWAMAVCTVLLFFSQAYFYYMLPGADSNQFRGLTEYFISTGNLSASNSYQYYFQWPFFFIWDKIAFSITGLDQRYLEFLLYGLIGFVITSFVYLLVSRIRMNAYVAVIAFFIVLIPFSSFEFFSPFILSVCLTLLLLYLDNLSGKLEVQLAMIVVFIGITLTHILVPLFFIIYCLVMYFLKKNKKYLNLFLITLTIYTLFLSYNTLVAGIITQLTLPYFVGISSTVSTLTTTGSLAPKPYISVMASIFSRISVISTAIITGLGFIFLLRARKFRVTDYAMLITGCLFIVALFIAPAEYSTLSSRSYFLIFIPVSLGASYLCESKLRKYVKPVFLLLLVLFTFTLISQTFSDQDILLQTKAEYQCENFLIGSINWTTPTSVFSNYRVEQYLIAKSSSDIVRFWDEYDSPEFPQNITGYTYVVYTTGLAKSFLAANYSVEASFTELEGNHYDLIYNSGDFSCIFSK